MTLELAIRCFACGTIHYVTVNEEDCLAWGDGALIQDAFPYLSATEREQLISGLCPKCQDEIFG